MQRAGDGKGYVRRSGVRIIQTEKEAAEQQKKSDEDEAEGNEFYGTASVEMRM